MWYSEEVSYAVGAVMLVGSALIYYWFVRQTLPEPPPSTPPRSASGPTPLMLKPAMGAMVATYVCLGIGQILEGAARQHDLIPLFQVGLFFSLAALFFAVVSLEWLTRRNFASALVAVFIVGVAIWTGFQEMDVEKPRFWAGEIEQKAWGVAWLGLLVYWNVCLYNARHTAFSNSEAFLIRRYGFWLLNFSALLALGYAYLSGIYFAIDDCTRVTDPIVLKYRILGDTPSLICTLAVIHIPILPFFLRALRKGYVHNLPPMEYGRGASQLFWLALLSVGLTSLLLGSYLSVREAAERLDLWLFE